MENVLIRSAHFHFCIREPSTISVPLLIVKFHGAQRRLMQIIVMSVESGEIVILSAKQVMVIHRLNTFWLYNLSEGLIDIFIIFMLIYSFRALVSKKIAPQVIPLLCLRNINIKNCTLNS